MNTTVGTNSLKPAKLSTTPPSASRKVYVASDHSANVRVPFREISVADPTAPTFRVYDTSGPYTDPDVAIDLQCGLPRLREGMIAKRANTERYQGRATRPEDDGNVSADRAVSKSPVSNARIRALAGKPVTQFEFARAGIITEEMIFVAERENLGRKRRGEHCEAEGAR